MAYQTLVADLSCEDVSVDILAISLMLAEQHGSHLTGLHVMSPMDVYVSMEVPIPAQVTRQMAEQRRVLNDRLKQQFEEKTVNQNFVAEWRCVDPGIGSTSDVITEFGNTSDLLIMSQFDGDKPGVSRGDLPAHVLSRSGRPVLIVPRNYKPKSIGNRVFVAWDGRRESTRALFGALPLLRRADSVRLHRINPPNHDRHQVMGITEELANTLSRHGVSVEVSHSDARTMEIGEELLGFARDMDADVVVMGSYGHSAVRDFLLGSTTRYMLSSMHVPLLMSN